MERKYYTPKIEEFVVGFEYQYKNGFTDGTVKTQNDFDCNPWIHEIVTVGDLPYIERALNGKNSQNGLCGIRVKCLDRDDIGSFKFSFHDNKIIDNHSNYSYIKDYADPRGFEHKFIYIIVNNINNHVLIFIAKDESMKHFNTLFTGNILNKSELGKILRMVAPENFK